MERTALTEQVPDNTALTEPGLDKPAAPAEASAEAARAAIAERWQMSRAGLVNFWYYGNQEFELEQGRLILRGANGSGKSVTMQSFLPLVLDGDKRPHRLDPFGSRDRRIDYYLLLDPDGGFPERTAYLWMEFANPSTGRFRTVGIGLRARRGGAHVAFWGFLLDDGRRINRDFWLFHEREQRESGSLVPLTRKQLEEAIGQGGEVVQEQSAYQDLVNKALFRFPDADSYQDLLQLLVQLRSPKLSKDFKPTAIYDILQAALPPLLEDELSPLSEVLEDMDEIGDRLEELQQHFREVQRLLDDYRLYNEFMLLRRSQDMLHSRAQRDQYQQQADRMNRELEERAQALEEIERRMEQARERLQESGAELDVLENHEALNVQRELEMSESHLRETNQHREAAQRRLQVQRERLVRQKRTAAEAEASLARLEREQRELLEELESAAREIEFAEHDAYSLQWSRSIPEQDSWRQPWRRDLSAHRRLLEEALGTAREERTARQLAEELERQVGDARKERDEAERSRQEAEREADGQREKLKEAYLDWSRGLQRLPLGEERLREMLRAVTALDAASPAYDTLREPAAAAYAERHNELLAGQARVRQQLEQLRARYRQLEQEQAEWQRSREPEPPRTVARREARAARGGGTGAPLFEVCEFRSGVGEDERALLEEQLERAGLLDAWIAPDGRLQLGEGQEDSWLVPAPHPLGYTLAERLEPVPSDSSGLSYAAIEDVLRSFLWEDEPVPGSDSSGSALLTASGGYRLGPLAGVAAAKPRAEFIGKETRRRTRELMIRQLQEQMEACAGEIGQAERQLAELAAEAAGLKEELAGLPGHGALQAAFRRLADCRHQLDAAVRQEQRLLDRLAERMGALRELQSRLAARTAAWSRLKRESDLAGAVRDCAVYEGQLLELHAAWRSWTETESARARAEQEGKETAELIGQDEETETEHAETARRLRAQIVRLRQMIEELGVADIYEQIRRLKEEQAELRRGMEQGERDRRKEYDAYSLLRAERQQTEASLAEAVQRWQFAYGAWQREWALGLLHVWRDRAAAGASDEKDAVRLAREIEKGYKAAYENRERDQMADKLMATFNDVRHTLNEYVLSLEGAAESGGRLLIASLRDKLNPQPLWMVAEEIRAHEEEQRHMLTLKDRELYEEIILRSVGKSIRQKIARATAWVEQMRQLMAERNTSSGLRLSLDWEPKPASNDQQLDTEKLVKLLMREAHRLDDEDMESIVRHFRDHIVQAKADAQEEKESLRKHIQKLLDYREWFEFRLYFQKGGQTGYKELTDSRFNVLSGGEKAMAMYIPLLAATYSRYSDAAADAPRLISLDEAFAGVDEENMKDMFQLLTDMEFDYMMTSQVLWGCYSTVPRLAVYEIYRPKDADYVTTFHYRWDGKELTLGDPGLGLADIGETDGESEAVEAGEAG